MYMFFLTIVAGQLYQHKIIKLSLLKVQAKKAKSTQTRVYICFSTTHTSIGASTAYSVYQFNFVPGLLTPILTCNCISCLLIVIAMGHLILIQNQHTILCWPRLYSCQFQHAFCPPKLQRKHATMHQGMFSLLITTLITLSKHSQS